MLEYLFFKDGKILLGKRKGVHGAGTWCPPGGHLEYGETSEQCAARETLEEAGIDIKNIRRFTYTNDIYTDQRQHYITLLFVAEYTSGELKNLEPHNLELCDWFAQKDLPDPLSLPLQNLQKMLLNPFTHFQYVG